MSAFNVLNSNIICPCCGNRHRGRIQFKFGDTWQFDYKPGDVIVWGGNQFGVPDFKRVKVYGIAESVICPFCNQDCIPEEYDIFISDNVIVEALPVNDVNDYLLKGDSEGLFVPLE